MKQYTYYESLRWIRKRERVESVESIFKEIVDENFSNLTKQNGHPELWSPKNPNRLN